MASLSRSALREHIFKIVFTYGFGKNEGTCDDTGLKDNIELYLDHVTDEKDEPVCISEADRDHISEKSLKIFKKSRETDALITKYAQGWEFDRIGKAETGILRLSIYEILFDDDIPKNVAIDEAVELAKKYGDEQAPGFINGILSSVAKEADKA